MTNNPTSIKLGRNGNNNNNNNNNKKEEVFKFEKCNLNLPLLRAD
jgi:hypothetical protein